MRAIRVDIRLLRPGVVLDGIDDGLRVRLRVLAAAGDDAPWREAGAAGLPVPDVRAARCDGVPVLAALPERTDPLGPGTAAIAVAQAGRLGAALAARGIGVGALAADDLGVRDGLLRIVVPVAGEAGDPAEEAAAFVATVAAACRVGSAQFGQRRRRLAPLAVAVALIAAGITVAPRADVSGPPAAVADTIAAVPLPPLPLAAPLPAPVPAAPETPSRVRPPVVRFRGGDVRRPPRPTRPRPAPRGQTRSPAAPRRVVPRPPPPADAPPLAGGEGEAIPAL